MTNERRWVNFPGSREWVNPFPLFKSSQFWMLKFVDFASKNVVFKFLSFSWSYFSLISSFNVFHLKELWRLFKRPIFIEWHVRFTFYANFLYCLCWIRGSLYSFVFLCTFSLLSLMDPRVTLQFRLISIFKTYLYKYIYYISLKKVIIHLCIIYSLLTFMVIM